MTDMELALTTLRRTLREESERRMKDESNLTERLARVNFARGIAHSIQILEAIRYGVEAK